jgi:hypothetical protein
MTGDKEKFNFYLSGDIMREFKDMCFLKHGSLYGAVAFELEKSMNRSISEFKNGDNTHTQKGSHALELRNRIIEWLKINYRYGDLHDVNVPRKHLTQAITAIEDKTDIRTINSRIDLLMSNQYIEEYHDPEAIDNKKSVKKYRFKISEQELNREIKS